MKALTIRQPWVWAILHGGKRIENRPKPTKYRGRFYIHAGLTVPRWQPLQDVQTRCGQYPDPELLPYGVIVGTAELIDCVWSDVIVPPWGEPQCWHWKLADIRTLRKPIPVRGQLGLWNFQR